MLFHDRYEKSLIFEERRKRGRRGCEEWKAEKEERKKIPFIAPKVKGETFEMTESIYSQTC